MKAIRYGTPSGNLWVLRDVATGRVGVAEERDAAEAAANAPRTDVDRCVARAVRRFAETGKAPMLVVGSNNWVRLMAPFALLQRFDVHVFFYPNSSPVWVAGAVALDRVKLNAAPIWFHAGALNSSDALKAAVRGLVPSIENDEPETTRLNQWLTQWIYRCPKISLKDVLHLEPYPADSMASWKADGNPLDETCAPLVVAPLRVVRGGA